MENSAENFDNKEGAYGFLKVQRLDFLSEFTNDRSCKAMYDF